MVQWWTQQLDSTILKVFSNLKDSKGSCVYAAKQNPHNLIKFRSPAEP